MRGARCPTCRVETPWTDNPHRPFCSERCRLLDLAAWADERFRIPGEPLVDDVTDPSEDDDRPPRTGS